MNKDKKSWIKKISLEVKLNIKNKQKKESNSIFDSF